MMKSEQYSQRAHQASEIQQAIEEIQDILILLENHNVPYCVSDCEKGQAEHALNGYLQELEEELMNI